MKITLEHNELLALQRIAKGHEARLFQSRSHDHIRIIGEFCEAGMATVKKDLFTDEINIFGPITITPLGQKVLRDNLPYVDAHNKAGAIWGTKSGILGYGIPK